MKFAFAFLLAVAAVHANSLHRYGWTPGKESIYHYESQVLNGITEIRHRQMGGLKLTSNVRVQSFSDYSLRIKMENIKFVVLNGDVQLTESGRIKGQSGSEGGQIPEEFMKHLQEPFLAHLKSGVVQSFQVSKEEPSAVTNIKRSFLAQLQLDVSGSQRSQIESNHIQLPTLMESELKSGHQGMTYFFTNEESVHGKCRTSYAINKIPEYKVKELEGQWQQEENEIREEYSPYSGSGQGKAYCDGKPYYQIVKTRDLDNCERHPIFQKWTGISGACMKSKPSTCAGLFTTVSSSTYTICGELSQYQIRNVKTLNVAKTNPIGFNTDENFQSATQVNVELLKVTPTSQRLPLPASLEEKHSIVYAYPKQSELEGQIPEEVRKQSMEILGVQPVLPQPNLHDAPHSLLPLSIPRDQIKSQAVEQLKKMASEVSQSPESCSSKSDIAGTMTSVAQYLRHLSLSELQQLESQIKQEAGQQQQGHSLVKLFWDTVSGVGTNPSTMLVVKKIKEGSMPTGQAVKLVLHTLRNVRYPTKELLQELVGLAKHQAVKSNVSVLAAILGNLSDLFYRAYVNPSTMINNFPGQIYGAFGSMNSQVLTEQFIPYLTSIAEGQEPGIGQGAAKQKLQYTAIASLGRTGHIKAIKPLLMVAEGKFESQSEQGPEEAKISRPLAVHSLKRIAKMNPSKVKPLLIAIIENTVEAPEVRIAAVAILPFSLPSPNDIQAIAIRSWFDPSRQVVNFIRTTLYSLLNTEIPEFKPMSGYVKSAIPLMKKEDHGYMFARNMHFNQFVHYLQTGVVSGYQLEMSKKSFVPLKLGSSTKYYGNQGAYKIGGPSWVVYMQGMDRLVQKYIKHLTYAGKTSDNTVQQLQKIAEQLGIQTRGFQPSQLFGISSVLGIHYDVYLDSETVTQLIGELTREIEQSDKQFSFNTVSGTIWQESTGFGMTDAGFPVVNAIAFPIVYSAKGHVRTISQGGFENSITLPKVEASLIPVVNIKVQSSMGVISPFTKEILGTGVEASVHSSIPIAINGSVSEGELVISVKNPPETERSGHESETLHGFVLPYTFKKSLLSLKPNSKAESLKQIISGTPRVTEIPVGQSIGLSAKLVAESNNLYSDLYSYLEKIKQTSMNSVLPVASIPSSVRMSSTKLKYSPSQSSTKEFQLRIKLRSHVSSRQQVPWFRPIRDEDVESDFKSVKDVLEQIKSNQMGVANFLSLSVSSKGQYSSKFMKSAFIVGKASHQNNPVSMTYAAMNYKFGSSGSAVYGIQFQGKATLPKVMNRWNLDQLVQEQLSASLVAKVKMGMSGQEQEIQVFGKMQKSEEQKQSVQNSPEYKKCQQEMQEGRKLTSVCREVRLQACSLDKLEVNVERFPSYLSNSRLVNLVKQLIEATFIGQISYQQGSGSGSGLVLKAKFERTGHVAQAQIITPSGEVMKIQNIRLYGYPKNILPLPVQISLGSSFTHALSKNLSPFTCTVEPKSVTTFDNRTYQYQLNNCEHLLLQDGAKNFPIAVLARYLQSGSQQEVRIISGVSEVKVSPQGGSPSINVNGQQVQLNAGEYKQMMSSEGSFVQVEMKKYQDNAIWLHFPQQQLSVVTDGNRVELVGYGILWNRAVGLCGDMNGEAFADLKSPKKCVMTPQSVAVSYLLNKSGSSSVSPQCQGIPSQYKQQYQQESQRCVKERVVPTPLNKIFNKIGYISVAYAKNHVVIKQVDQVCISKQMLNTCQGKPLKVRQRNVEFACVPRPSVEAKTLEERAYAGEPLAPEVGPMPTVFRRVEVEPSMCSSGW